MCPRPSTAPPRPTRNIPHNSADAPPASIPIAPSRLPPQQQNTCPTPTGLFNPGLQRGFARYQSLLCSTPSFCLAKVFEPRKLVFWRRKWRDFRVLGVHFVVFWAISRRKAGTFSHFLRFASEITCFSGFGAISGYFCRFWGANPTLFLIFCRNITSPRGR